MSKADDVVFLKKRRFRYTYLEERKMWHFFVRELKAQNPDALRKRVKLWEMYEEEEKTAKKMYGLESHFRKYMLPRIIHAAVHKEDLFLLLRFFHANLKASQRKELEFIYDCKIECDRSGFFLRAQIEDMFGDVLFFPTAEQESTILRPLDDDENEYDNNDENEDDNVQSVNNGSSKLKRHFLDGSTILRPLDDGDDDNNEHDNVQSVNNESSKLKRNFLDGSTILRPLDDGDDDNNEHDNVQSVNNGSSKLKRHFLDGSIKFLDGCMDLETFVSPFVGGKFEKVVRTISWLSEKSQHEMEMYS